jgi:hypothetical protein
MLQKCFWIYQKQCLLQLVNRLPLRNFVREGHECYELVVQQLGFRWSFEPNWEEVGGLLRDGVESLGDESIPIVLDKTFASR